MLSQVVEENQECWKGKDNQPSTAKNCLPSQEELQNIDQSGDYRDKRKEAISQYQEQIAEVLRSLVLGCVKLCGGAGHGLLCR